MALGAYALTSLAQAKAELGVTVPTHDAVIERLIDVASSAINEFCDRTFHYETGIVEKVAGYGGQILTVAKAPIVSIASIELLPSSLNAPGTGTTYAATSYTIKNAKAGTIYRKDGFQWTAYYAERLTSQPLQPGTEDKRFVVTYAGGWTTRAQGGTVNLPPDIEQACLWSIANLWRQRGREIHVQQETEDAATMQWKTSVLPKQAQDLMKPYRRVR
jgi:hypothetical protein